MDQVVLRAAGSSRALRRQNPEMVPVIGDWSGAAHVVAFCGGLPHQAGDGARGINLRLRPIESFLPDELMKR